MFHVAVPNSTVRTSARHIGFSSENVWCMNELGRVAWAHYFTNANGQTGDMTHWVSTPPADMPAGLRRMFINASPHYVAQDGALVVATSTATIEIGLFKELLTVEPPSPPSPLNGTYRVFTTNGQEHTLAINFDAGTYVMTDAAGLAASGAFQADPADPGTYVFASSRVSVVYNTARFRVATDGIVGAFPFATYGSDPVSYSIMPFVAARSFVTNRSELAGTYDVSTFGIWALRFNAEGTTATRCADTMCTAPTDPNWSVNAGAIPGQWKLDVGSGLPLINIYIARFGTRRVLLSSFKAPALTIPPSSDLGPYFLLGFRQPPADYSNTAWPSYALHTMSGVSFGKATLTNTGYAEQTQNQNGQVTPMSLSFNPPFAHMPSVRFVTAGSDSYALVTHNGEIVLMLANVRGPFLGLIDR